MHLRGHHLIGIPGLEVVDIRPGLAPPGLIPEPAWGFPHAVALGSGDPARGSRMLGA